MIKARRWLRFPPPLTAQSVRLARVKLAVAVTVAVAMLESWCRVAAATEPPDTASATLPTAPVPAPNDSKEHSKAVAGGDPLFPPNRNEFIIVPDVGGNSDIGVEIGASLSMAGFRPGYTPYAWRLTALASMSFKDDIRGFRAVQQYHAVRIDLPQFLSPNVRLDVRVNFLRDVDSLWYGIGNHTSADPAPPPAGAASANQYTSESFRLRSLVRVTTGTRVDFAVATNLRYEFPTVDPGSQVASDLAAGYVVGDRAAFLETLAEGFIIDTRDNEFTPHRGIYYQVGVGETVGTAQSVSFGEVSAVLSHYLPLGQKVVFANRLIGSFKWGNIPFYEL